MKREDFDKWFSDHLELMAGLGVMHPNSPWGRSIRLSMAAIMPQVEALQLRVSKLEEALSRSASGRARSTVKRRKRRALRRG